MKGPAVAFVTTKSVKIPPASAGVYPRAEIMKGVPQSKTNEFPGEAVVKCVKNANQVIGFFELDRKRERT